MPAREFTGHIRAMRADTDYFGAEDFVGDVDIPLRIERVLYDDALKVGGGKPKPQYYLELSNAAGKPCRKRMLLNAGRRKMLAAMYGGIAEKWRGRWVWVYCDRVKNPAGGDDTIGMKFRNRTDAPKQNAPTPKESAHSRVDQFRRDLANCKSDSEARDLYERSAGPDSGATQAESDEMGAVLNELLREMGGAA